MKSGPKTTHNSGGTAKGSKGTSCRAENKRPTEQGSTGSDDLWTKNTKHARLLLPGHDVARRNYKKGDHFLLVKCLVEFEFTTWRTSQSLSESDRRGPWLCPFYYSASEEIAEALTELYGLVLQLQVDRTR